jgi:hypothetical protein
MKQDEIRLVAGIRPEAEPYDPAARAEARRRLTRVAAATAVGGRPRRRVFAVAVAGALALAVAATAAQVLRDDPERVVAAPAGHAPRVVVSLEVSKMSAEEVLGRAAEAATDELRPRDDQFIVVESQVMHNAASGGTLDAKGEPGPETRWLDRSRRIIWRPADDSRASVVKVEHLDPLPYPGWPIPEEAYRYQSRTEWFQVAACPTAEPSHYTLLKRLPTDPERMRDWLYTVGYGGDRRTDEEAWSYLVELLGESYLPAAQRAALFQAAGGIGGVTAVENAEDAAGRTGIAVGRVGPDGVRQDLIFDPRTYEFLGERGVVVDAEQAKAPAGSLVSSTARLKVSVADSAPSTGSSAASDQSC